MSKVHNDTTFTTDLCDKRPNLSFLSLKTTFRRALAKSHSKLSPLHSAFEGRLRGSVISNFHDVAGFYMLVGAFSEGIGPQLPQILTQ